jgi:hypothetical protein
MSGLPPQTDIKRTFRDVRFGPYAALPLSLRDADGVSSRRLRAPLSPLHHIIFRAGGCLQGSLASFGANRRFRYCPYSDVIVFRRNHRRNTLGGTYPN